MRFGLSVLLQRYAQEFEGRFVGARSTQPESVALQGHRLTRALRIADELQTAKRSLARIEEFLLGLCNRIAEPTADLAGQMPGWFADAMIASRNPSVFWRGAASFIHAAGHSHEHVCRTCKTVLGVTPSHHINRVRIEHAARLLASGDLSIAEIAEECGIANISHFYTIFRAQCGLTRWQYRLRHSSEPFDLAN